MLNPLRKSYAFSDNLFYAIRQICGNLLFLMFLNGFFLASIFYLKMDSSYENGLFTSIKADIDAQINGNDTPDSIVIKAMHVCYHLMSNKGSIFTQVRPRSRRLTCSSQFASI